MAANPPGPGLPRQEPSVWMATCFVSFDCVNVTYPPIWYISTLAERGMSGVAAKRSSE